MPSILLIYVVYLIKPKAFILDIKAISFTPLAKLPKNCELNVHIELICIKQHDSRGGFFAFVGCGKEGRENGQLIDR